MTYPNARIYVDPDGVISTGARYGEHAQAYAGHLAYVQNLRAQYGDSWGDDDLGDQFRRKFEAAMDAVELAIKTAVDLMRRAADDLEAGGRRYRNADEAAYETGLRLARQFDGQLPSGTLAPTLPSGTLATDETGQPIPAAATSPITPATWRGITEATPGIPAYDARDLSGAKVNGQPPPDGQRLVAFSPLPDGTIQIDANLYETLTPVVGGVVTGADGQPVDPDGGRFFVVRDASDVDPAAPGYRPLHVSFPAGGNRPVA
jgi:hypothetical protein